MSIAKAYVTGTVTRAPEKRYTQNNLAITGLTVNIDKNTETLLRVVAYGQLAENTQANVSVGDEVAIEGKLQVNSFKLPNGKDKKVFEINAVSIDKIGTTVQNNVTNPISNSNSSDNIVTFEQENTTDDLIDEEEIPF